MQLLIALYDNKKPTLPTDVLAEFLVAELVTSFFSQNVLLVNFQSCKCNTSMLYLFAS